MLHQLLEHTERHRRDVRPGLGRVHDVERIPDRRREHLGLEAVVAVDLADVADQIHAGENALQLVAQPRLDLAADPGQGADRAGGDPRHVIEKPVLALHGGFPYSAASFLPCRAACWSIAFWIAVAALSVKSAWWLVA